MNRNKGSRIHILNWIERDDFLESLNRLLAPTGAVVGPQDEWMPKSRSEPLEARLENWPPRNTFAEAGEWQQELRRWWLRHHEGANTPNWDFASTCDIDGRKGLVLIEAKAYTGELSLSGKKKPRPQRSAKNGEIRAPSVRSEENHLHISQAIEFASRQLNAIVPGVSLSAEHSYQLANRIAYAWWLARKGIPVVLVYLGFLNDRDMGRARTRFTNHEEWAKQFAERSKKVLPKGFSGQWIECGAASFHVLVASLEAPTISKV